MQAFREVSGDFHAKMKFSAVLQFTIYNMQAAKFPDCYIGWPISTKDVRAQEIYHTIIELLKKTYPSSFISLSSPK